jgi:hypothetical protein
MCGQITFLDCPAYLDAERRVRCGLPAEIKCRFVMDSTDGPLESAMIRCPSGHCFSAPVEFLTYEKPDQVLPGRTPEELPAAGYARRPGPGDGSADP